MRHFLMDYPLMAKASCCKKMRAPPVSRPFFMKMAEQHPYLVCFFEKQLSAPRISIIFRKNA